MNLPNSQGGFREVFGCIAPTTLFHDNKSFGGPLAATKVIARTGDHTQTV
jgi:hypothetical protein